MIAKSLITSLFKKTEPEPDFSFYNTEMELREQDIQGFIQQVKNISRYDFTNYSEKSFRRRIEKILIDHDMSIGQLGQEVTKDNKFLEQIVKEITVNTTELFRDKDTWFDLAKFVQHHFRHHGELKIWSAGCSNGLEVYSLSILLNELGVKEKTKIFATDLNTTMLERARKGEYPYRHDNEFFDGFEQVMPTINPSASIDKYFNIDSKNYRCSVKPKLKSNLQFSQHNLVELINPYDTGYDLILCRNVLIYFNHALQEKLFHFFHRHLNYGGALILGVHEGMLGPVSEKYMKVGQVYNKF